MGCRLAAEPIRALGSGRQRRCSAWAPWAPGPGSALGVSAPLSAAFSGCFRCWDAPLGWTQVRGRAAGSGSLSWRSSWPSWSPASSKTETRTSSAAWGSSRLWAFPPWSRHQSPSSWPEIWRGLSPCLQRGEPRSEGGMLLQLHALCCRSGGGGRSRRRFKIHRHVVNPCDSTWVLRKRKMERFQSELFQLMLGRETHTHTPRVVV